jgi:glucokinase
MARYCIGVDLGGTYIKFGLLSEDMKPSGTFQLPTPKGGAGPVIAGMVKGARKLMADHKLTKADVVGVGVGAPGPMNIKEGIIIAMPNIPGIENCPMGRLVGRKLGIPAVLENDANAAGYGEYVAGAGKDRGDMVLLTLGTGIGGGIVVDGKVVHGAHDIGAEIGHLIVEPGGEPCGCGQRGCIEAYASASNLARYAISRFERAKLLPTALRQIHERKKKIGKELDMGDVNAARKAGDALAAEVWDRGAYYLALACVSISRLLDPNLIVLVGGMTKAGDDLIRPVTEHYRRLHWILTAPKTKIVLGKLGNDAGMVGAAGVAWAAFGGK